MVKNLPANAGDVRDTDSIPGLEDPLEEGMATHSSILTWRIQWSEEPSGLQSIELERVRQLISRARKVRLKILQARLQQYVNQEIPDV